MTYPVLLSLSYPHRAAVLCSRDRASECAIKFALPRESKLETAGRHRRGENNGWSFDLLK